MIHLAHEHYGVEVPYRNLTYAAIQGMLRNLDPHTSFLTPEAYDNMRHRQQGSFYGVGILVSKRNGRLTVIAPIEGTPASRLGMRSGDVIQTVDGEPTASMTLVEAMIVGTARCKSGEISVALTATPASVAASATIRRRLERVRSFRCHAS